MASEISLTASLSAFKAGVMKQAVGRSVNGLSFTMTGSVFVEGTILVGTSITALPLGQVTSPHWAYFCNLDPVNYLLIRNGPLGADLLQLFAGEPAFVPLPPLAIPYAIANTAPVYLEYLILSL